VTKNIDVKLPGKFRRRFIDHHDASNTRFYSVICIKDLATPAALDGHYQCLNIYPAIRKRSGAGTNLRYFVYMLDSCDKNAWNGVWLTPEHFKQYFKVLKEHKELYKKQDKLLKQYEIDLGISKYEIDLGISKQ
jgi:hypothetical protein